MRLGICVATLIILATSNANAATPALAAADQAAAFKAAGFKQQGREWIRCEGDESASRQGGSIEAADLNGDGVPEAWVRESSLFCYGNTGEAFVLLTKKSDGWTVLLDTPGVAMPRKAKTMGWPDIEVGGPGMGPMPVYHFNGTKYVRGR